MFVETWELAHRKPPTEDSFHWLRLEFFSLFTTLARASLTRGVMMDANLKVLSKYLRRNEIHCRKFLRVDCIRSSDDDESLPTTATHATSALKVTRLASIDFFLLLRASIPRRKFKAHEFIFSLSRGRRDRFSSKIFASSAVVVDVMQFVYRLGIKAFL
jgi:hypothetical protein